MVAALSQSLVHLLDTQLGRGYRLPSQPSWVVRDNRWRATRYGLDAIVITDAAGSTAPLRDELYELYLEIQPVAQRAGLRRRTGCAQRGSSKGVPPTSGSVLWWQLAGGADGRG